MTITDIDRKLCELRLQLIDAKSSVKPRFLREIDKLLDQRLVITKKK